MIEFSATANCSSVAKLCVIFLGEDWIYSFMKRHPNLSLQTAEATSLTRSTSFNRTNVATNWNDVLVKHKFEACQIYNIDETALTTVHKPPKVAAQKNRPFSLPKKSQLQYRSCLLKRGYVRMEVNGVKGDICY